MTDYLVFSLVAAMGSFGRLAGHERRGSENWPGHSAILGILGAALGVRRTDAEGQKRLREWNSAVAIFSEGTPLRDFHTVQAVPSANIKRPATRRAALAALKSTNNAVITRRDYRTDCAFGIAVWGGQDMECLRSALKQPHFSTYLGRKSCPLMAPMDPQKITASELRGAFENVKLPPFLPNLKPVLIVSGTPMPGSWMEVDWDDPIDRERWQFGRRNVYFSVPENTS